MKSKIDIENERFLKELNEDFRKLADADILEKIRDRMIKEGHPLPEGLDGRIQKLKDDVYNSPL